MEYIKERKTVALEDLAAEFGLRVQVASFCAAHWAANVGTTAMHHCAMLCNFCSCAE